MESICPPVIIESSNSLIQIVFPAVAVIIAFIALGVSLWSLWIQRKHNRKSVRPVGHIQPFDSLQGLHIRIVNKGCGPMLINKFTAVRDEVIYHNIVYHLPENILDGFNREIHTEPEGYWLGPGDELTLLRLQGNHTDPLFVTARETVRSVLSGMVVSLSFCDVYDEKHPVFEKSLEWYRRAL